MAWNTRTQPWTWMRSMPTSTTWWMISPRQASPPSSCWKKCSRTRPAPVTRCCGIFISTGLSGAFDGALRAVRAVTARNIGFKWDAHRLARRAASTRRWPVLEAVAARDGGEDLARCAPRRPSMPSSAPVSCSRRKRLTFSAERRAHRRCGGASGQPHPAGARAYRARWVAGHLRQSAHA